MRRLLVYALVGATLGATVASFVVPPALSWYNETGRIAGANPVQTLCNVPELIRYATSHLIRGQLIGAAIGAVVFLVVGILVERRRERRSVPTQLQPLS